LLQEREGLLDEINERRDERSAVRQKIAARLNEALMPDIKVQVRQYGDRTEYREYLAECLRNEGIKQGEAAKNISTRVSPTELGELVKANDPVLLMQKTGIPQTQAAAVLRALNPQRLFGLEVIDMDDLPSIQLRDGGRYKESSELSTGQKCTAILPILMFHSANPLLVDQPEDNLDNNFVYRTVVSTVKVAKETRQMVFITHNPNIPVLGEASQILVMKSDGITAATEKVGTVDECKKEIISLLEGGKEAFDKRAEFYK
jgi:ABC-type dipeptide/oligopeptide/nickel transport system ATPase subunit